MDTRQSKSIRKSFDQDLHLLKEKLFEMNKLAQQALQKAYKALKSQNMAWAGQVIDGDAAINQKEEEIEVLIVQIITTQQPVASDLRKIMSALKITTSVERVGDFAVDIAKATKRIGHQEYIKPLDDLPLMFDTVQKMLSAGLDAYMHDDVELAQDVARMDDYVDQMYGKIMKEMLMKGLREPEHLEQAIQLAYIARFVERIADHATNISEAVYYIVKGERVDLNQ